MYYLAGLIFYVLAIIALCHYYHWYTELWFWLLLIIIGLLRVFHLVFMAIRGGNQRVKQDVSKAVTKDMPYADYLPKK